MRTFVLLASLFLLFAGCAEERPSTPTGGTPASTPPAPTSNGAPAVPTLPALGSVACGTPPPAPDASWTPEKPRLVVETNVGSFIVEIDREQAPVTAQNFLDLARSGFYDGTLFHRVVKGFVIQGGDPLSKDDDKSNDGTGGRTDASGKEVNIPDEFHPGLRHDEAGVLSMANSGPDTGSSQFFVTLAPTPHLDDRHSVFGRVVEGLDVVQRIGATQVGPGDAPVEDIVLVSVKDVADDLATPPEVALPDAEVHVVIDAKKTEAGRPVRFAVVLKNLGAARDNLAVSAKVPEGWACQTDAAVTVPAGTARVVFLTLTPPAGANGENVIEVGVLKGSGLPQPTSVDEITVTIAPLGAQVKQGDKVTANYAGLLPDGRLFDTSFQSVGTDPAQPKFETMGGWRAKPSYAPFPFTVGSGVIEGFTILAKTAKAGETVTSRIPAAEAYAVGDVYQRPLTGRDLIFELEIVKIG